MLVDKYSVTKVLIEQQRLKQKQFGAPKTPIDFLLEIPNLGLADGYGQSARSIVQILIDICKDNNLSIRILNKRNLCGPIDRAKEIDFVRDYLIDPANVGPVKVFMRYALPENNSFNAQRFIAMTMFETDAVPPKWVPPLNLSTLVLTPTSWGAETFSKYIKTPVAVVPLPVNALYYKKYQADELLPSSDKFRFITVGNYFQPDRKRLIPLIENFGKRFSNKNCELYVKSSWTDRGSRNTIPIDKVCNKYKNVILDTYNISTEELIKLYCKSHAALFPSLGEGYGLPHMESSLLGRPLVISDNSSMISMKNYMPVCYPIGCSPIPADYTPQHIDKPGNWGICDMDKFLDKAENLYEQWVQSPTEYNKIIIEANNNNSLRNYISHDNIKSILNNLIIKELDKIDDKN